MRMWTAVLLAITLLPAAASAQTYGSSCIEDRYHRYSFTTPSTDWVELEATLYYNRNTAFLILVFDEDSDVVVSTAGAERFVRLKAGLLPDERYELWVGCIGPAAFRFDARVHGQRRLNNLGTRTSFGDAFSPAEQARTLALEAEMERRLAKMER